MSLNKKMQYLHRSSQIRGKGFHLKCKLRKNGAHKTAAVSPEVCVCCEETQSDVGIRAADSDLFLQTCPKRHDS